MAIFTMTLKEALETYGGNYTIVDGETRLEGAEIIGLAHYPEYKPGYRERLNGLIFDRYMNNEIGLETVSMFAQAVRSRMNEQMPTINKLYMSTELEFDPLSTVDMTTSNESDSESHGNTTGTSTGTTSTESGTRAVNQDFPQHALRGNADYASSGSDTKAVTEGDALNENTGTSLESATASSSSRTHGYQGRASELLMSYRESLLNVDQMVIDSLKDCFMGIWDVPESYTNGGTFNGYYS